MKFLIIAAVLIILAVYLYLMRKNRKYPFDNNGRRSGKNRRKSFVASKNKIRRSDKERRQAKDPRIGTNPKGYIGPERR
jgi:hypothetical protein